MNYSSILPESENGQGIRDVTIAAPFLNIFAGAITVFFFVIFVAIWKRFWNTPLTGIIFKQIFYYLLLSIPVHEVLHALGFKYFGKITWAKMKFGFSLRQMVFYAHPTIPLNIKAYTWAVALPALIIGVLPLALGLIIGSLPLGSLGLISIFNSAGDLLVIWKLREVGKNSQILDHPDKIGFKIIGK